MNTPEKWGRPMTFTKEDAQINKGKGYATNQ